MSRHTTLQIRLTHVEKAQIRERAIAAGKTVSDYIRDRALGVPPSALTPSQPPHAGQSSVEEQIIAAEVGEAKMEDGPAREAFLERRTQQLIGQGRTSPVAHREAEREWEERAT